jgi:hypothetical protein
MVEIVDILFWGGYLLILLLGLSLFIKIGINLCKSDNIGANLDPWDCPKCFTKDSFSDVGTFRQCRKCGYENSILTDTLGIPLDNLKDLDNDFSIYDAWGSNPQMKFKIYKYWSSNTWNSHDGCISFHPMNKKWMYYETDVDEFYELFYISLKQVKYFIKLMDEPIKFVFDMMIPCPDCKCMIYLDSFDRGDSGYCPFCETDVFSIEEVIQISEMEVK